jgi:hypothetical protein
VLALRTANPGMAILAAHDAAAGLLDAASATSSSRST